LIDGAIAGTYNLNVAGYGDQNITSKLEANKDCPHIKYYGKVTYTDGLRIMYNSDIIYAMYSKKNPNHLFAAPNKYYEAMFVGKPIITTNGIIVADKVKENHFGYSIDESIDSLTDLIRSVSREDVSAKSEMSASLWDTYKLATEHYLNTTYSEIMQIP
jgi:glycosyltransferase involved in cell wall biosynthesis